ncbi:MAG: penicillin acylase family protein [Aquihabitans sp.]
MTGPADARYAADIRWTTHGVAHIRADDWGGLGYGQGYACARDHLPTIADQIVKVRSERAAFHGPGAEDSHLASDFGYLALGVVDRAPAWRDAQPDHVRQLMAGYTVGYNQALAEAKANDTLPRWCADAEWIRPITELDLYAYLVDVALMASGRNLAGLIGRAEAPGPDGPVAPAPLSAMGGGGASEASAGASNGWALGRDVTASGHGIIMSNPHFPWSGEARFWECHLTIPGELDVYGVSLLGTGGVQIGFNADVAWTHTFSRGSRFTLYKLDLVADQPTSYRYGDEQRDMTATTHTIEVANSDGSRSPVERTLWSTHYGPMLNLPLLGWGLETAFTYRDANLDNMAVTEQFLATCTATSLDELQQTYADVKGMPWVNTLATDRSGRVWYTDASATPNLSPAAADRYDDNARNDAMGNFFYESRLAMLDGSNPDDEWVVEDGARNPGLIPPARLPQLERTDYVLNANDPHWLTHPDELLTGYSPLHGLEAMPTSLRTRQNVRTVARLARAGDATVDSVIDAVLDNESLSAELLRDEVVARARNASRLAETAEPDDLIHAADLVRVDHLADVLEAWDGRFDLDSVGALLWRELMVAFTAADFRNAGGLFAEPFDPADPVNTPRRLTPAPATGTDPVIAGLVAAAHALEAAGLAPDSTVGKGQFARRGDRRVPVHGGGEGDGVLNILAPLGALSTSSLEPQAAVGASIPGHTDRTGLRTDGYGCTYGTSYLMAVEMTDHGPHGFGLLAYGQSGDDRSPHHVDGTEAYSSKTLRPLLFTDEAIAADPNLTSRRIESLHP